MMRLYDALWMNDLRRNTIISTALTIFFFFTELYLIAFPLESKAQAIPFGIFYVIKIETGGTINYPLLAIAHIVIFTLFYFFLILSISYLREVMRLSATGVLDLIVSYAIVFLFALLIHEIALGLIIGVFLALVIYLFYLAH